jgi:hypothetical protein
MPHALVHRCHINRLDRAFVPSYSPRSVPPRTRQGPGQWAVRGDSRGNAVPGNAKPRGRRETRSIPPPLRVPVIENRCTRGLVPGMHLILQGLEEEGSSDMPGGLCVPKILPVQQLFMDMNGCLPDPSAAFSCLKRRPGNPDRAHRILVVCICEYPGLLRLGGPGQRSTCARG